MQCGKESHIFAWPDQLPDLVYSSIEKLEEDVEHERLLREIRIRLIRSKIEASKGNAHYDRFDHDVFPMKMNSSHRNRKHGFPASVIFGQAFFHGNEGGRF